MTTKTTKSSPLARLRARIAKWEGRIARGDALQRKRRTKLMSLKKRLRALGALLVLSLSVQVSSPPLSPADAVAVLRASKSDRDRSNVYVPSSTPELPRVVVVRSPTPTRVERVRSIAEIPWAARQAVPWIHVGQPAEPTFNVRILR